MAMYPAGSRVAALFAFRTENPPVVGTQIDLCLHDNVASDRAPHGTVISLHRNVSRSTAPTPQPQALVSAMTKAYSSPFLCFVRVAGCRLPN